MDWNPLLDDICQALSNGSVPEDIRTEEHFERQFVEPIVRSCVASQPSSEHLCIAKHPWVKPGTEKSDEQQDRIQIWRDCKLWANVTAWGMMHTLDIFVWDKTTDDHECIAIEVKLCKTTNGKMPTGEFQRMIGQSTLFLGEKSHKAVVAVFGFKGDASGARDDNGMGESLRRLGIWPVVLRVP